MIISIYLKDSVLTTQSRTIMMDLKPKTKKSKKIFSKKCIFFCILVSRNSIVKMFLEKELSLFSAELNRQNLKAVFFSSGRLLHPPSPVFSICLRIARARPTKILKTTILPKKPFGFFSTQIISVEFCFQVSVANLLF